MNKKKSLTASIIFFLVIIGVLALFELPKKADKILLFSHFSWILFVGIISFLILFTGRISRWRSLFFVVMAGSFIVHFKAYLLGLGKNPFFSPEIQEVPYCHIAIVSSFFNVLYQQYLAFQSGTWKMWGPLSLGFLWLAVTLTIGQAWCSWGCFYGGLDDGFSRILKNSAFKKFHLPEKLRDIPAAILLFVMLISLSTMLPIFCLWVCPLKFTTAFLDTHESVRTIQLIFFITVGALALIILPILIKKRVFCGLICPFGAWQSFFGRINPFRVTIFKKQCTHCGICVKVCPTFVLNENSFEKYAVSAYCNRCGECMDACPSNAIRYTLLGKEIKMAGVGIINELMNTEILFLFTVILVGGSAGGVFVPTIIARIVSFFLR